VKEQRQLPSAGRGPAVPWTEENTRRLLQAAATVPEPDEALLLRVERRLQVAAEQHSYAAQSGRRALILRGVVLAYLFCLIASASLGFRIRHSLWESRQRSSHYAGALHTSQKGEHNVRSL